MTELIAVCLQVFRVLGRTTGILIVKKISSYSRNLDDFNSEAFCQFIANHQQKPTIARVVIKRFDCRDALPIKMR